MTAISRDFEYEIQLTGTVALKRELESLMQKCSFPINNIREQEETKCQLKPSTCSILLLC